VDGWMNRQQGECGEADRGAVGGRRLRRWMVAGWRIEVTDEGRAKVGGAR
jgi:hypothetical protein